MPERLVQILEGAILAADQPLSIDRMMALFDDAPPLAEIRAALAAIEAGCTDRGFELKEVASGYRFQVKAEYGERVSRLWDEKPPRYSRALLETLALIAYKQPITRGDIEEIRGVSTSTNIIRSLLEREWIRVVGHRDVPGRPALYASTRTFLDYFNLSSLEELPTLAEIRDLDKINAELDLDTGEQVEPHILELERSGDGEGDHGDEDAVLGTDDLEAVTDQVNQIQENIRNLFAGDTDDADLDTDLDAADFGGNGADEESGVPASATSFTDAPDILPESDVDTMVSVETITVREDHESLDDASEVGQSDPGADGPYDTNEDDKGAG